MMDDASLRCFCTRLGDEFGALYPDILEATQRETAFVASDSEEITLSCIGYVKGFADYFRSLPDADTAPLTYRDASKERQIRQIAVPWDTVAVILPQSAFVYLAVTCLLNAVATGNRVILRAPAQSQRSAELLSLALERSQPPDDCVSVVRTPARAFLASLCGSDEPVLIHYLGSSAHAADILGKCFEAGKHVIIDGEGNTWVRVDEGVSLDDACDTLASGAVRYNGQTCTSINGAIIHPAIYDQLKERLCERWSRLVYGDPTDAATQVGPLLDESQAEHILRTIKDSEATVLAGGHRQGNLLAPTLAAEPCRDSELVSHGFFGPALWIAPGDRNDFTALWRANRYPLCAGILTGSGAPEEILRDLPNLARLTVNADPSVEYLYEPWGGYPSAGTNPVSHWSRKYVRIVQIDHPA